MHVWGSSRGIENGPYNGDTYTKAEDARNRGVARGK